jgi:glycine cleavage system H lipoate-binding protein/TusA-related sulfurtransferase
LEVHNCEFAEDVLYDQDFNVWVKLEHTYAVLGITSIHSALAGKLTTVKFKEVGTKILKGHVVATIESVKYFGAVRTPLTGTLIVVNEQLAKEPALANDYPYSKGWFVKMALCSLDYEGKDLSNPKNSVDKIESQIRELGVRCFKTFPDYEMWEIGVECAAVLSKLGDMMERCQVGDVVHVVSDDKFADIEIARWSDQTGQALLEARQEDQLLHFIVKKVK